MGIIGVVAALTLPNLNSSTGDKEKVAKVKKIYQNLNDAFGRAQAVYGPLNTWCVGYSGDCEARSFDRILEFLKTSKKCDSVTSCSIELSENVSSATYSTAAILADGTTIGWSDRHIDIDIDGIKKGKNRRGYDVFTFYVNQEKGVFVGHNIDGDQMSDSAYVYRGANGYFYSDYAAAWIINFDNMDYLKTSDGTTCPDGKTKLTFGGNHTCK